MSQEPICSAMILVMISPCLVRSLMSLMMIMGVSLGKIVCQSSVSDVAAFPLGITDGRFETAYVSNGPGISAIDLGTGKILWVYEGARWPVWRLNEMLLVLANTKMDSRFHIQLINARNAGDTSISQPLRISQPDARSLAKTDHAPIAKLSGDSIDLTWPRSSVYYGGANPPVDALHKNATVLRAGVRIDLHSLESGPVNDYTTTAKSSGSLSCNGSEESCQWTISGTEVMLEIVKGRFLLRSVDSAHHQSIISLGRISRIAPYVTLDRHHVIISRPLESGEVQADIYSVLPARKIGRIPMGGSIHDATVFGSTLFALTQTRKSSSWCLTSLALPSGTRKWEFSIYRPLPQIEKGLPQ